MDKKIIRKRVINTVIVLLQALASAVAVVQIKILDFLTAPMFAAVCTGVAVLLVFTSGLFFRAKKVRLWAARILSLLLTVVLAVGTVYLHKTYSAIQTIVEEEAVETVGMGVYVLQEDPAQNVTELADYDIGILETMGRENTDAALLKLEEEMESRAYTKGYASPAELALALLEQEVEAVILNEAYLDVIEDMGKAELQDAGAAGGAEDTKDGIQETDSLRLSDFSSKIRRIAYYEIAQDQLETLPKREEADDHTLVFYLSGIDTRGSKKNVSRSDVNILVLANTQTKQILMVNTPRDSYVPLSVSGGAKDKLTHAGLYGVDCSMDTLSMLYDVDIDYYFRVNFSGFEKIIDALGGIDVYSDFNFTHEGYSFHKGKNHLNGAAALHFARDRYSFPNGDRQRGEHQMKVISAVFEKIKSPSVISKYAGLMDSLSGAFDTNMPYEKVAELVQMQLSDGAQWNIVTYNVDGTGAKKTTYSIPDLKSYVLVPDENTVNQAKDLMRQLRHGKVPVPEEE